MELFLKWLRRKWGDVLAMRQFETGCRRLGGMRRASKQQNSPGVGSWSSGGVWRAPWAGCQSPWDEEGICLWKGSAQAKGRWLYKGKLIKEVNYER